MLVVAGAYCVRIVFLVALNAVFLYWYRRVQGAICWHWGTSFCAAALYRRKTTAGLATTNWAIALDLLDALDALYRRAVYLHWMHWMLRRYCRSLFWGEADALPRVELTHWVLLRPASGAVFWHWYTMICIAAATLV